MQISHGLGHRGCLCCLLQQACEVECRWDWDLDCWWCSGGSGEWRKILKGGEGGSGGVRDVAFLIDEGAENVKVEMQKVDVLLVVV